MNCHASAMWALVVTATLVGSARAEGISPRTRQNLSDAMKGEAFAFVKYSLFAEKARREGHADVAAAFASAARQERLEHFMELAEQYGLVKSTEENLRDAIKGETYEAREMYPEFAQVARKNGDEAVAKLFDEISRDEAKHAAQFTLRLRGLSGGGR